MQIEALKAASCERIYQETASGALADGGLRRLLDVVTGVGARHRAARLAVLTRPVGLKPDPYRHLAAGRSGQVVVLDVAEAERASVERQLARVGVQHRPVDLRVLLHSDIELVLGIRPGLFLHSGQIRPAALVF